MAIHGTRQGAGWIRRFLLWPVYAAGTFATVAGMPVRRVAEWDGTNWFPLGAGETNGLGGRVNSLAVRSETELFA